MTQIKVLSQYIKDLSFEVPGAPAIFLEQQEKPNINLSIDIDAKKVTTNTSEVTLKITANAAANDKAIFICEVAYSGLFLLTDVEEQDLEQVLLIYCPNILFPFIRRIIANTVSDGGFLPLMVEPIDFADLYNKRNNLVQSKAQGTS